MVNGGNARQNRIAVALDRTYVRIFVRIWIVTTCQELCHFLSFFSESMRHISWQASLREFLLSLLLVVCAQEWTHVNPHFGSSATQRKSSFTSMPIRMMRLGSVSSLLTKNSSREAKLAQQHDKQLKSQKFTLPRALQSSQSDRSTGGDHKPAATAGAVAAGSRPQTERSVRSRVTVSRDELERLRAENDALRAQAARYMLPTEEAGTSPFLRQSPKAQQAEDARFPHSSVLMREFYQVSGIGPLLRPDTRGPK
jgi:hypothetical protein